MTNGALRVPIRAAISLQIMELIADKKGIDRSAFATIHADLDKMKIALGGGGGSGSGGQQRPPPSTNERDLKRPRM